MQEARFMVFSSEIMEQEIKPTLITAGAVCRGWYGLTDIIFGPEEAYNAGFVRLRIARGTRNPQHIILVQKETVWGRYSKTDTSVVRKEFTDLVSANAFIHKTFGGALRPALAFSREGVEYALKSLRLRIFTEDILVPSIRWSVEIEGDGDIAIAGCATMLGLGRPIHDSLPALVYKNLPTKKKTRVI